jgi:hypothetical protein
MEKLEFEQRQLANRDLFRWIMSLVYILAFLPTWFIFLVWAVTQLGVDVAEALALGTATGIFLAAFKDMWQFLWRKS